METNFFIPFLSKENELSVIHWTYNSIAEFKEIIKHKREHEKEFDFETDRLCHVMDENGSRDEWLSNLMK